MNNLRQESMNHSLLFKEKLRVAKDNNFYIKCPLFLFESPNLSFFSWPLRNHCINIVIEKEYCKCIQLLICIRRHWKLDPIISVFVSWSCFFRLISCLKCYIDFDTYFFYPYNFDIFMYLCCVHVIFCVMSYFFIVL